jgi:acetaldehyde dehydrogenase/alcohol dehydrogenase
MAHKIGGMFHTPHGRTNAILMPYVIEYNCTKPTKLGIWPKYEYYKADERYQEIAQMLGLPAKTPAEGVKSLKKAVIDLTRECGIEMSFKAQGVDEKAFLEALPTLAMNAYEDQCSPANPRLPMVEDMQEIMRKAYYGEGLDD